MIRARNTFLSQFLLCWFVIAAGLFASIGPAYSDYQQEPYQQGKDVVWVPTSQALARGIERAR